MPLINCEVNLILTWYENCVTAYPDVADHPLTNFKIQKYYQKIFRFNGVPSRDNLLHKITDEIYVINLDEHSNIGFHWVVLYALDNLTYFDSFGVEHIPKETKKFIGNKT